ncbi:hypothetical protein [Marinibacterium sp. SX1]|uniref:hypothetical protein n=1 Tax=Marinibacterium sp. SX1 TaxID=3388424 RepID=UPI003D17C763
MTVKTALAALALTCLPALGFAECNWSKQQAQSCAPGTTWDSEAMACVDQVTS